MLEYIHLLVATQVLAVALTTYTADQFVNKK